MVCPICKLPHDVKTISHQITITWKGEPLTYKEDYNICTKTQEKYFTEEQLSENWRRLIRAEKTRYK